MLVLAMLTLQPGCPRPVTPPGHRQPVHSGTGSGPDGDAAAPSCGAGPRFLRRETMTTNVSRINECDGYGYTTICGLSRCDPRRRGHRCGLKQKTPALLGGGLKWTGRVMQIFGVAIKIAKFPVFSFSSFRPRGRVNEPGGLWG